MTLLVRRARAEDLSGLLLLYRELRPNDPVLPPKRARALFTAMLARDDVAFVVCDTGKVIAATCMLALIPNLASDGKPIGVIEHVITLASHRQQGLAKRVLEYALALAWEANCCKVMLLSGAQRPVAHKLYESVGFNGDAERGFVAKRGIA